MYVRPGTGVQRRKRQESLPLGNVRGYTVSSPQKRYIEAHTLKRVFTWKQDLYRDNRMRSLGLALIQCEWRPCEKGSLTTDANTERTPCAEEGKALGDTSTSSRRQHQSCQQAPEARGGRCSLPASAGSAFWHLPLRLLTSSRRGNTSLRHQHAILGYPAPANGRAGLGSGVLHDWTAEGRRKGWREGKDGLNFHLFQMWFNQSFQTWLNVPLRNVEWCYFIWIL